MPQSSFFGRILSALKRSFSLPGSLGASFFSTTGGVVLEGNPTAEMPLLQVPAFLKVVRAITRNIAQVPFQVGQWQKPANARAFQRHWESGYGRAFKIARPVEALKREASEEVWVPAVTNPAQGLFDKPSPWLSRYQLWEAIETYLLHDGEAFIHWIGRGENNSIEKPGQLPLGLELLPANRMSLNPDTGTPQRWKYQGGDGQKFFEFWQICRPALFSIYNPFRGLSLREACGMSVNSIWSATRLNRALLENGGYPGGLLIGKTNFTPEQKAQLRQSFEDTFSGPNKAGRVMPLWGDVTFQQLNYSHRNMQFLELIEKAEQDIRGVFKVPESEVSEYENTSYASSDVGRRSFWEATILPDLRLIEDALWTSFFSVYEGGRFEGRFDLSGIQALQESRAPKVAQAQQLFSMGYPANVINQYLGLGLPEISGGETGYLGAGLIPVGSSAVTDEEGTETAPEANLEPVATDQEVQVAEEFVLNGAQISSAFKIVEAVAGGSIPRDAGIGMLVVLFNLTAEQAEQIMGSAGTDAPTTPNPKGDTGEAPAANEEPGEVPEAFLDQEESEEEEETKGLKSAATGDNWSTIYWRAWIGSVFGPQEKSFGSKYRRYVMDLRASMLARLEKAASKKVAPQGVTKAEGVDINGDPLPSGLTQADVDSIMFEREEWDAALGKRMLPAIKDTVGKAIKRRARELNLSTGFLEGDDAVARFIAKKDVKLVEQVNGTLANQARDALLEGIAESESVTQLSARLRDVFNNASNRAGMVARTETLESAGWATYETDKRSGVVEKKEWLDSHDENVRDSHVEYGARGPIPFDQEWASGLKFPGDTGAEAGEVINCRCTYIPVLKDEERSAAQARAMRFAQLEAEEISNG